MLGVTLPPLRLRPSKYPFASSTRACLRSLHRTLENSEQTGNGATIRSSVWKSPRSCGRADSRSKRAAIGDPIEACDAKARFESFGATIDLFIVWAIRDLFPAVLHDHHGLIVHKDNVNCAVPSTTRSILPENTYAKIGTRLKFRSRSRRVCIYVGCKCEVNTVTTLEGAIHAAARSAFCALRRRILRGEPSSSEKLGVDRLCDRTRSTGISRRACNQTPDFADFSDELLVTDS